MWHILYPQEGAVRHLCCSQFQVNRCTAERSSDVNLIPMAHRWDDLEVMENWISSQLQTSTDMMAKRTDTRKAWAGPFGGDEPHQACQIRTGKACRKGAIKSIILLEVGGGLKPVKRWAFQVRFCTGNCNGEVLDEDQRGDSWKKLKAGGEETWFAVMAVQIKVLLQR